MNFVKRLEREGLHRRVGGLLKEVREGGWEECRRVRSLKAKLAEARSIVLQNEDAFADTPEVLERIGVAEKELGRAALLAAAAVNEKDFIELRRQAGGVR